MAAGVVAQSARMGIGLALALNYVVAPLAMGAFLGWGMARFRGGRVGSGWALATGVALPTAVCLVLPGAWFLVGVWDAWFLLTLASIGWLVTGHCVAVKWGRKEAGLLLVSLLVGAGAVEGGYRLLAAPAPGYMPLPPSSVQLFLQPTWITECGGREETELPFPDLYPLSHQERVPAQKGRPHAILHVGDSMIWGNPSPDSITYVGLLDATDSQASHINAGMPGTGPDYQYLLVSNWVQKVPVDAVVVHFTGTGDLRDMDLDHCFCGGGPILSYLDDGVAVNCPTPLTTANYSSRFLLSPPPYFLRVLAASSLTAQGLCAAIRRAQSGSLGKEEGGEVRERVVRVFATMRKELARRNIALVVVRVPDRWEVDALRRNPAYIPDDALVKQLREAGVTVLEPQPALVEAVGRAPQAAWFRHDVPQDAHFGVAGHAFMARWLQQELAVWPKLEAGSRPENE
jgi:hypothetical protein